MKKLTKGIVGYLFFFGLLTLNSSLAVVFYSTIENKPKGTIAILILIFIIISSLVCTLIDVIRRKIQIEKPAKDILQATKQMAKGDFNVLLLPDHKFNNYTRYDLIKEDLNFLAKELSKNEILKNDFISNVSHEIKTPLAVIQNYAKALTNKNLDEETKEKYLNSLQNACKKLSDLITNILKLNKLENQNLKLDLKQFNLSESITNQILNYETLIENKNIELECDIEEDINIISEETYLEIIWSNLISNAIKFTDNNGKIIISLRKLNNEIIFKIKDTGCGIDSETGKNIFEKFYQGDTSHSKEGNGLGLALVKKVIDILGGKIQVESEKGIGTTFTVKLKPLDKASREEWNRLLDQLESELAGRMVESRDRRRLFRAVELVRQLRLALQFNANAGQLAGWLCAGLFLD